MAQRLRTLLPGELLRAETLAVLFIVLCPIVGVLVGRSSAQPAAGVGGTGRPVEAAAPADPDTAAPPAGARSGPSSTHPGSTPGTRPTRGPARTPDAVLSPEPAPTPGVPVTGRLIPAVDRQDVEELLRGRDLSETDELIVAELERRGRLGLLFPERTGGARTS